MSRAAAGRRARRRDRPRRRPDPDRRRARVRRRPPAPVRARSGWTSCRRREERQAELDAGARPGLPRRRPREVREADWTRRPGAGRPRRPAGRDHRPGRAQDDDQRAQLGRAGVHGRPRGRAVADLGQRRRRPGRARRRRPPHAHVRVARRARRTGSTSEIATLVVRPRGWHLVESRDARRRRAGVGQPVRLRAVPVPQRRRGACGGAAGRTSTWPSSRSHHEARLWNEVFVHGQAALGIPRGSIRATVLIETILAAFEMDEILYELREHAAGLNAGRWDYLFSGDQEVPRRGPTLAVPGPRRS